MSCFIYKRNERWHEWVSPRLNFSLTLSRLLELQTLDSDIFREGLHSCVFVAAFSIVPLQPLLQRRR